MWLCKKYLQITAFTSPLQSCIQYIRVILIFSVFILHSQNIFFNVHLKLLSEAIFISFQSIVICFYGLYHEINLDWKLTIITHWKPCHNHKALSSPYIPEKMFIPKQPIISFTKGLFRLNTKLTIQLQPLSLIFNLRQQNGAKIMLKHSPTNLSESHNLYNPNVFLINSHNPSN